MKYVEAVTTTITNPTIMNVSNNSSRGRLLPNFKIDIPEAIPTDGHGPLEDDLGAVAEILPMSVASRSLDVVIIEVFCSSSAVVKENDEHGDDKDEYSY